MSQCHWRTDDKKFVWLGRLGSLTVTRKETDCKEKGLKILRVKERSQHREKFTMKRHYVVSTWRSRFERLTVGGGSGREVRQNIEKLTLIVPDSKRM